MDGLVSSGVTLLIGAVLGVAGTYIGQALTDSRRERRISSQRRERFTRAKQDMPELMAEMRADLAGCKSRVVREFVVSPSASLVYTSSKRRFIYYGDKHEDLQLKVDMLERAGLVERVQSSGFPVYRLTDELVSLLSAGRPEGT